MPGLNASDFATLPPMTLLAVTLITVLWFVWQQMKISKEMQRNALEAGNQGTIEALKAFRETMTDQRTFHAKEVESTNARVRLVEERMRDLEEQLEDKNDRISDLEREGKNKDRRIEELEEEVRQLRERLNEKTKPKKLTNPKRDGVSTDAAG